MGPSIGWTVLLLTEAWIVFIWARTVAASNKFFFLALRLILVVSRAAQYIVDGGLRFRWEVGPDRYSFDRGGYLRYAYYLPDIPPELVGPDQFFHHKLQASTSVGLVPMVPMVVTPQRKVALCGIRLNGYRPF